MKKLFSFNGGGEATTADSFKLRFAVVASLIAMLLCFAPSMAFGEEPEAGIDGAWQTSKSKIATNLDENFNSNVTLSLPSAEKNLKTDIVFVFDESSCSEPVKAAVSQMMQDLYAHVDQSGADIQIGAVQFRGEVTEFPLTELNAQTKDDLAAFMGQRPKTGGSNMTMGILAGEAMLDADASVDADRKYMILVSDGITYIWDDPTTPEQENIGVNFSNADMPDNPFLAGPDGWDVKYGREYVPASWDEHFASFGDALTTTLEEKASVYDRGLSKEQLLDRPFVKPAEFEQYLSTVDIALYMSKQAFDSVASKYTVFVNGTGVENEMNTYPYGPSFMQYLSGGNDVSFDDIEKQIVYFLDYGSEVHDYMGYVDGDYDFDFVAETDTLSLSVGEETYPAVLVDENCWGFKPVDTELGYAYFLEYVPADKKLEEHFDWYIYEPITNFNRVQLNYTVHLTNPKTEAGEYGQYDANGSMGYEGLFTNREAFLEPIDSMGNEGAPEFFPMPTVSYVVEEEVVPPTDDPETDVDEDTPEPPAKPETDVNDPVKTPEVEAEDSLPQTGDSNVALSVLAMIAIVSMGAVALSVYNVKRD